MQLSLIYSKPSAILRALTEARLLMANHARELTEAMDELIVVASEYIDAQGKVQELGNQEDEDQVRESAVEAARMVAKILVSHGGDAARAALGVPPPDPLEQQRLRSILNPEFVEWAASGLNSVVLEIDDDADHGTAGRHYRVSASLYLPVNLDDEELQRSGPWGARWIAA
jgi:hypothetical protein